MHHWRVSTNRSATVDEYGMQLHSLFQHSGITFSASRRCHYFICRTSVDECHGKPVLTYLKRIPFIVGPGIKTGLNVNVDNPKEVGADRIVNAVAALELYGAPCIVVDFGTATTYDYID